MGEMQESIDRPVRIWSAFYAGLVVCFSETWSSRSGCAECGLRVGEVGKGGAGTMKYADGGEYTGEWKDDKRTGQGTKGQGVLRKYSMAVQTSGCHLEAAE